MNARIEAMAAERQTVALDAAEPEAITVTVKEEPEKEKRAKKESGDSQGSDRYGSDTWFGKNR
jgi:hypothetical protein